ncbi:MAG: hypothetical protein AAF376_19585 [Pseudomonadota bacterium]
MKDPVAIAATSVGAAFAAGLLHEFSMWASVGKLDALLFYGIEDFTLVAATILPPIAVYVLISVVTFAALVQRKWWVWAISLAFALPIMASTIFVNYLGGWFVLYFIFTSVFLYVMFAIDANDDERGGVKGAQSRVITITIFLSPMLAVMMAGISAGSVDDNPVITLDDGTNAYLVRNLSFGHLLCNEDCETLIFLEALPQDVVRITR